MHHNNSTKKRRRKIDTSAVFQISVSSTSFPLSSFAAPFFHSSSMGTRCSKRQLHTGSTLCTKNKKHVHYWIQLIIGSQTDTDSCFLLLFFEEGLVCGGGGCWGWGGGGDQTLYREKKENAHSNTNVIWLSGYYTGLRIQRLWVQTSAKTVFNE